MGADPYPLVFYGFVVHAEEYPAWMATLEPDFHEGWVQQQLEAGVALPDSDALVKLFQKRKKKDGQAYEEALRAYVERQPCTLEQVSNDWYASMDLIVYPRASLVGERKEYAAIQLPDLVVQPGWDAELTRFAERLELPVAPFRWCAVAFAHG